MIKKLMLVVMAVMMLGGIAGIAQASIFDDEGVALKQTFVGAWQDGRVRNATVGEFIKTGPVEGWPNWANALIDGWSIDAGPAYDASNLNNGVGLLGREVGTLGKYLKFLKFPFADKLTITIYPIGVLATDLLSKPKWDGCYGVGYIKATIKI